MKIIIDIETDELIHILSSIAPHHDHHSCSRHISVPAPAPAPAVNPEPQPEPQTAPAPEKKPKKQRTGNLSAYKPKSDEAPKTEPHQTNAKAPSCVDVWAVDELNLLRTCRSVDDAKFVYESHYPGKRSPNAVHQKWYKISKGDKLITTGKAKVVDGMLKLGFTGNIVSITDDRQGANMMFTGDPATYQIGIEKLERVE